MSTQFVTRIGYSAYETPEALKQAIARAKKLRCDRVMLFNSRGHIEPAHLDREEILRRAEVMRTAAAAFRKAGIGVGINNLATIGMNFSPPRKHRLPFQNLVDFDGRVFTETFCPLDKGFQDYLGFLYAAWAAVGPDEVWVDDDFRYKSGSAQCFCPLHLAEFGKMTGRDWPRDGLVAELVSPGPLPNDLARLWARLQDRGLYEAARAIARGVRRADPNVRIAFMGITGNAFLYGTALLRKLRTIFSPAHPPLVRPEYGAYSDEGRTAWNAYRPLWCCRRAFGEAFVPWPELETWPLTGYNHGRKVALMKLAWGAVHGFSSSTISVNTEPETARAIAGAKRHVAAISEVVNDPALLARGVSLELSENRIGLRSEPGLVGSESNPPRLLMRLGIPLWPDGGCGRILVGNSPLIRRRELKAFAREGLVLDRPAFETLCALGGDDILGGARSRPMGGIPVLERFIDSPTNGQAAGAAMSMEMAIPVRPTLQGSDLPDSDAFTALSWFEDADGVRLSAGLWTRQWRGGRLAVLPFSLDEPGSENAFLNRNRQWQLECLLEWLTGAALPVRVHGAPDLATVYRESRQKNRVVIGLANFSLDAADGFSLVIPALEGTPQVVMRVLDGSAKWQTAERDVEPGGRLVLGGRFRIPAQEVRLIELAPCR